MSLQSLGTRGIIGAFFLALSQYMGSSWIDKISMLFSDSDQAIETYKWLGMVPQMREWIGGKNAKGFRDNGLTIANKDFEATLEVLVKDLRRDKTGQAMIRIAELAARAGGHWGALLSTLITNGTGTTSGLCYDGQYFFDDDHSEGESGTQKNLLTATEVPVLNIGTATTPTSLEAAKAILGVIAYMINYKDDQGEPINADAKSFLVMTSPALWPYLCAGAVSETLTSGESNPVKKIVESEGYSIQIVPNPRLAFTTQFATFIADGAVKAFIRQEEVPISMKVLGEGSDVAFMDGKHLYSVEASRNVGYGLWQKASHSTFS